MKVIEHLAKATEPMISFEVIPPKRGGDINSLLHVIDDIVKYKPPYIEITSHSAEVVYDESNGTTIKKRVIRKRPGTLGICALIQKKYNIDAVPHILCQGFTREETEDFLIELQYLEIENLLAIRGDESSYKKPLDPGRSINVYALDLVKQMNDMNNGKYLDDALLDAKPTDFCIGVAGYPEKHFEAPNIDFDIAYLKKKLDAGADYVVTQMFFDNQVYFDFVKKCRTMGIDAPIIPGLKIATALKHLTNIPRHFHVDIPNDFTIEMMEANPEHHLEIGVNWAKKQVEELLNNSVPAIHFYIMQNSKPVTMLMKKLGY
jgi:methylenetetrahydrofolate reductase (NADPH)